TLVFRTAAHHALVDVGRLLADQVEHAAGGAVEADVAGVVADVQDHLARDRLEVDPCVRGDFAGDDRDPGLDHGFAGHVRGRVLGDDGVQHRVRDLVGDLVRMAFGHGLGGEQVVRHRVNIPRCGWKDTNAP